MVVLVPPPAPATFDYVTIALCINGGAMLAWANHVFKHKAIIERIEGPRAMEKKTPLDAIIWKICAFWLACAGAMCILVADTPAASRVAMLLATTHFAEMYFKFQAASEGIRSAGLSNMALGTLLIVTLLLDYRRVTSSLAEHSGRHTGSPFVAVAAIIAGISGLCALARRAPPGEAPDPALVA